MMAPSLSFRRLGCSLLLLSTVSSEEAASCSADNTNNDDPPPPPPKSCRLLLTQRPLPSTNNNNNNERILDDEYNHRKHGIYSATSIPKNYPLTPLGGDLVIHLVDVRTSPPTAATTTTVAATDDNIEETSSNQLLKWYQYGYLQDASSSGYGGNYEGLGTVYSVLPGVGMLASSPPSSSSSSSTTATAATTSNSDNDSNNNSINNDGNNDNSIKLRPNIWASIPENDNGNHVRYQSPLAGSFTSYYNLTFQVTSPTGLDGGSEIWMDRFGWYKEAAAAKTKEKKEGLTAQNDDDNINEEESYKVGIDQLFKHGSCLDNIYPTHTSKYGYGRGALSSRYLAKGSVVAPVPVLPVPRDELRYLRVKEWKRVEKFRMTKKKEKDFESSSGGGENELILPPDMKWRDQLLLNYCYGHEESSVLLFPYGLFVNYINHAPLSHDDNDSSKGSDGGDGDGPVANVKLRWSERLMNTTLSSSSNNNNNNNPDLRTLSPTQLWENSTRPDGLILELVATRDIQPDEEILLDYGAIWSQSWNEFNDQYGEMLLKLADDHALETEYSQAYIMDEAVTNLRTAEEQVSFPYADNVFTACFYRYDVNDDEDAGDESKKKKKTEEGTTNEGKTQATPWKMTPGLFDMTNLRPCKVISRQPANDRFATQINDGRMPQGEMVYTAIIQNRPGLPLNERIPKGKKHVVSGIPRGAFRFVDRPYTTDVHLDGVFRHNIGVEEMGLYPEVWLDLKKS